MKDIIIKCIPHASQSYDTLGDYQEDASSIKVFISSEMIDDYQFLISIHELVEMYLCKKRGVRFIDIDKFDKDYEDKRNGISNLLPTKLPVTQDSEPGDDPNAPYYEEHQFASSIERLLCNELGLDWHMYEQRMIELLDVVDHEDRHHVK